MGSVEDLILGFDLLREAGLELDLREEERELPLALVFPVFLTIFYGKTFLSLGFNSSF